VRLKDALAVTRFSFCGSLETELVNNTHVTPFASKVRRDLDQPVIHTAGVTERASCHFLFVPRGSGQ